MKTIETSTFQTESWGDKLWTEKKKIFENLFFCYSGDSKERTTVRKNHSDGSESKWQLMVKHGKTGYLAETEYKNIWLEKNKNTKKHLKHSLHYTYLTPKNIKL